MQNLSKVSKIFLFLTSLFFALWLGGYVLRQTVIYQFFEPENLSLKEIFNEQSLPQTLYVILPIFVFNLVTYGIFIIGLTAFIITSKIRLRNEGWLFISLSIIAICAPFEVYLLFKDIEIVKNIYSQSYSPIKVINLIHERLTVLSSFSLIEILSYIGIVFLVVFKPLQKL